MSIAKPFTFISGTYAKSAEVNADFDTAYSQINTNISNIAKNASDITSLDSTKAGINGSAAEVFNVANPTASSHAINKQTFQALTKNSRWYINGYIISIDSGSPNDTIIVTNGDCLDSTCAVMLSKDVSTTKQNSSQSASTTYYVYVIGNSTGSSVDILISTSSSTPALPAGYTVYRLIGKYTTNSSNKIDAVYSYGRYIETAQPTAVVIKYYKNGSSWYRLWSDGWCEQGGIITSVGSSQTVTLLRAYSDTNYYAEIHSRANSNDTGASGYSTVICGTSPYVYGQKTDSFRASTLNDSKYHFAWMACGYIN